tara:strand:- start:3856 stop:4893 length:1038 start_codon:yes stop_codon:yes gene_type:complete
MIKIGLNGFGRIGRIVARILSVRKDFKLVVINEIDDDINNLAYLLKHDSIYGKFKQNIKVKNNYILINKKKVKVFSKKSIEEVPWKKFNVDVVIEATGVSKNVSGAKKVVKSGGVPKVLITHSPKNVDFTMILGVNEKKYNFKKHNIISSSICDASAIAPVLKSIDTNWGIENGYVTTLHPRLSYQNLLDGSLKSVSNPGHSWKNYSLGRDSIASLIPKKTTAVKAITECMPELKNKVAGMSFRVPTSIVCASDLTIKVKKNVSIEKVKNLFKNLSSTKGKIYEYEKDTLVSIDFLGTTKSVIVDSNFINVIDSKLIKMIIWYDNEWGYSNRVVDIAKLILSKKI